MGPGRPTDQLRPDVAVSTGHDSNIATKDSSWTVAETVERLTTLMTQRGMTIFATIDQRAAALTVGQDLRDTTLIFFGNPVAGTPIMRAEPLSALDLPLKVLVWDDVGRTRVSYLTPAALAARYDLSESLVAPLAGIGKLTDDALSPTPFGDATTTG